MAREKYELSHITGNLSNPDFWIHWVDANGEEHHTPRSLAAIIPLDAKILDR
jgi:hypothetical protein